MKPCFYYQVEEMEIPRAAAERSLREHKGDVVEALVSLTNQTAFKNDKEKNGKTPANEYDSPVLSPYGNY